MNIKLLLALMITTTFIQAMYQENRPGFTISQLVSEIRRKQDKAEKDILALQKGIEKEDHSFYPYPGYSEGENKLELIHKLYFLENCLNKIEEAHKNYQELLKHALFPQGIKPFGQMTEEEIISQLVSHLRASHDRSYYIELMMAVEELQQQSLTNYFYRWIQMFK